MWWLHLLIRRTRTLEDRAALFERLVRALGGGVPYMQRAEPLLLQIIHPRRWFGATGDIKTLAMYVPMCYDGLPDCIYNVHRDGDKPAVVSVKSKQWWVRGMLNPKRHWMYDY